MPAAGTPAPTDVSHPSCQSTVTAVPPAGGEGTVSAQVPQVRKVTPQDIDAALYTLVVEPTFISRVSSLTFGNDPEAKHIVSLARGKAPELRIAHHEGLPVVER